MEAVLDKVIRVLKEGEGRRIIGISGHGASGKSTFARELMERIGEEVNYLNTDPYIISGARRHASITFDARGESHSGPMTACHPLAHHTDGLERDIRMIQHGLDYYTIRVDYEEESLISSARRISIVEGMTAAFVDPSLFDVSVYLYTDDETELARRSRRDVEERGSSLRALEQFHTQRRLQYEAFMHPYRETFDVILRYSGDRLTVEKCVL